MKRFLRQIGVQIGIYVGLVLFGIPVVVFGAILFELAGLPYKPGIVLGMIGVIGLRVLLLFAKYE